jgi:hypothetical protein
MRRSTPKAGPLYRVFLSYSRQDLGLVHTIVEGIKDIVMPMWDRNFRFGHGFHEQIKLFIAHSHVFLPVITRSSSTRGWVHQEIGYAMALNIPVLPITVGEEVLPSEMIQMLQPVHLGESPRKWPEELRAQLTTDVLQQLVRDFSDQQFATFQCAEDNEDRAQLLVRYCDDVRRLGYHGLVRQAGALSSFHIPTEPISHPIWRERCGPVTRGPFHCRWQREERFALERHARECGCKIIINPSLSYEPFGLNARIRRLECLLRFLVSMPSSQCQVAINDVLPTERNVTIIGDWFAAEAVSAQIGRGYSQTIFTRHAPSVERKIELFDQEFEEVLRDNKWTAKNSRQRAAGRLQPLIDSLKKDQQHAR